MSRARTARPAPRLHPLCATVLVALALPAGQTMAQEDNDQAARLRQVVVSASGFEQDIKEAPASISIISREELENKNYRDLADALRDVEGIDVRGSTGKTGGQDISIRGMPSEYTLVLIDGRRQNVAGDVTPNGFSDALTSFMPPASAIERIEIIRGPMSTLYGSDAMGGVINIITRKVADEWGGSVGLETGIPENSDEGTQNRVNLYAAGPLKEDMLGLAIRGNFYGRGESDLVPSSGEGEISRRGPSPVETRQHSIGARLTLTPDRDHELWLDMDQARTWYNNDECQLGTLDGRDRSCEPDAGSVSGYKDSLRFNRDQVAIGHTSRLGFGTVESSLMRNTTETKGRTIPDSARPGGHPDVGADRELETTNTVLDTKLTAPLGQSHLLTVGGQYWDARMTDGVVSEDFRQKTWALFAEDEWRLTQSLTATLGLRYDHHDAFGSHVSPRGYLIWDATERLSFRGGVSRGYKTPRLNQLHDGISSISGQGDTVNVGNPNLKPETSTSTELGMMFDNQRGWQSSATLFHNQIDDKISNSGDCTSDPISSCAADPGAQSYPINLDEAKTWGLELSTRFPIAPRWSMNLNYTYTDSELIIDGQKSGKLSDTAKHVANASLNWDATDKLNFWLRGEYRGDSRRFDGERSDYSDNQRREYDALGNLQGYTLFHLGGRYQVSNNVSVSANIFNLFDKDFLEFKPWVDEDGVTQWGSEYIQTGRSTRGSLPSGRTFWLSANVTF